MSEKKSPFKRVKKIDDSYWVKCPYCDAEISKIALKFHLEFRHGIKNE